MKRTQDEFETGQPAILAPPHLNLFPESTNLLWMITVPLKEGKRVTLDGRCTFSYMCIVWWWWWWALIWRVFNGLTTFGTGVIVMIILGGTKVGCCMSHLTNNQAFLIGFYSLSMMMNINFSFQGRCMISILLI
jgi:hypothetical protein